MTPVISIVGLSGSGKTTIIEKLISELRSRGYRVASIKHAQEIHFEPGKDSERHLSAGSEAIAVATPGRAIIIKKTDSTGSLDDIARMLGDEYDIILAEGFKHGDAAKIVLRREGFEISMENLTRVTAVITDQPLPGGLRQFSLEDVSGLADFIEQGYIKSQAERVALIINGKQMPLTAFPRRMMAGLILGMVSSLKGVGAVNKVQIWLSSNRDYRNVK